MVQALSIRTKLIMAMLALVASVVLMGMTADDANAAGVTEIRWVENHTPCYVYVENHESGAYKLIAPYSAVSYNQWVPWARNASEFDRGKYIELGFYGQVQSLSKLCEFPAVYRPGLAIWQEGHNRQPYPGDKIRYTRPTPRTTEFYYNPSAPPMAGASDTGGRRNLIIRYTIKPTTGSAIMQAGLVKVS
jgi:hypothetical protein